MEIKDGMAAYGPGEPATRAGTMVVPPGDRLRLGKQRIPVACTVLGATPAVQGAVLWLPRGTSAPLQVLRLSAGGAVRFDLMGRSGYLVNDTDGAIVVHDTGRPGRP